MLNYGPNIVPYTISQITWSASVHGAVLEPNAVLVMSPSCCVGHGLVNAGRRAQLIAGPSEVVVTGFQERINCPSRRHDFNSVHARPCTHAFLTSTFRVNYRPLYRNITAVMKALHITTFSIQYFRQRHRFSGDGIS